MHASHDIALHSFFFFNLLKNTIRARIDRVFFVYKSGTYMTGTNNCGLGIRYSCIIHVYTAVLGSLEVNRC